MAILEEQFAEVEVIVDGQPALEYDNDDDTEVDTPRSVTKYIEVVPGSEFYFSIKLQPQIRWKDASCIVARPKIDGKKHTGIVLYKSRGHYTGKIEGEWSGTGKSAEQYRFTFANIETRKLPNVCILQAAY
jgi:hypothetical protein